MDIIVKARNCEVPSRLKQETVARVEHATRFFDRLVAVDVIFRSEPNPRIAEPAVVELTGRTKGHHIRAEGAGSDHRGAVDAAVTRFERQLSRYKARMVDRYRGKGRGAAPTAEGYAPGAETPPAPADGDGWPRPRIVRTKTFDLQPLLPDDAAVALELLGHDFYVFTNASTGRCNVVYRRRDGDLGLIEAAEGPVAS